MQSAVFDETTSDELHLRGSLKWSVYPESLPGWVAEMDFGCAPPIVQALHEAVETQNFGYLPPSVRSAAVTSAADWLRRSTGWDVPVESVRPLPDVLSAYELVFRHFLAEGAAVIVPTPSYAPFLSMPRAAGVPVIELPLRRQGARWVIDPDELDAAFRSGGGLLVLCDPHNPTGTVSTVDELHQIAAVVDRNGGRVFADAIHAPIVFPGAVHTPYAATGEVAASHAISAYSATKGWNLAGLKAAQAIVSNPADMPLWQRVAGHAEVGASTFGLIASTAAYSAGGRWLASVVDYLDSTRRFVASRFAEELPSASVTIPESTYFTWIDLRGADRGSGTVEWMRADAGVFLTDGATAGAGFEGWVRLNFATSRPVVEDMVDRIIGAAR